MSNPPPCHNHTQRRHRGKFVPRTSALSVDRNSSLRGILTMLWVGAFFFFATTVAQSVHQRKPVVSPEWAATLTHNAGTLVVTDALLVMSCAGVIPIALAVQRDLIPIQSARFVSGAALSAWFAAWFAHIFHQDWLWPQAFSLALHLIANLMKSYSYLATNVDFCEKKKRAEALREKFGKNCSIDDQGVERDELDSIERELVGDWSGLTFPSNITLANWMDYMLVPSLVYELDFPRLPK
ncbi:hypothetical protein HDU83_000794 [Entophlyctis luteolus]|nr:hypothetical protein HDU83_000794 [Entophlyctis luteolus]